MPGEATEESFAGSYLSSVFATRAMCFLWQTSWENTDDLHKLRFSTDFRRTAHRASLAEMDALA